MANETTKAEALTFRLPEEDSEALRMIAKIEGITLNALGLEGVSKVIQARKDDPEFRARAREYQKTMLGVYQSLLDNITDEDFEAFVNPENKT